MTQVQQELHTGKQEINTEKNKTAKEFHLLACVGILSIPCAQTIGMHSISCTH